MNTCVQYKLLFRKPQKNMRSNSLESMYLTHLQVVHAHIGRSVKC